MDHKEWVINPQTVTAVDLPLDNSINFSAAILQPPLFDPQAPAAVNYGAVGTMIGHEISHTFDSQGSAIDSTGRLRNWWTPADLAHFKASTARLAAQYDTYKPFADMSVNGKQTLAEDIADLGGLAASYDAYHASLGGRTAPAQYGFTGDQQFFIAFGQHFRSKELEVLDRESLLSDTHAPLQYIADTVRNLDPWYKSFNVQPDQKLYLVPADRVRIW